MLMPSVLPWSPLIRFQVTNPLSVKTKVGIDS